MRDVSRYRSASYRMVPAWRRWWPISRQEFLSLFRTKWGVALFFVCLFPGIGRLVMLLILFGVVNFGPTGLRNRIQGRADLPAIDPTQVEFYLEPVLAVMPGMVFVLLLTSLVVARAVARDRTTNALELYWTRGISPLAYMLAKWLGCFLLIATLTVAVPFCLWITAVLLADDWSLLTSSWTGMAMALAGLGVVTGAWTGMCVLISAVSAAPNTAMVLWSMLLVGSSAIAFVSSQALRMPELRSCFSVWDAGGVLVRAVAGAPQRGVSIAGSAILMASLLSVLALLARRRLRLVEAIA